ncbi:MAG: hypothetical protein GY906_30130 [bacterium]|nr:hypothetical protein [bacterium]
MVSETLILLVIIIAVSVVCFSFSLVTLGIVGYQIAKMYAPTQQIPRRVPALGSLTTRLASGAVIDNEEIEKGENGYPAEDPAEHREVAETSVLTEVSGAAEGTLVAERERWWIEKREEGYDDDEIKAMERQQVVPVFEGA